MSPTPSATPAHVAAHPKFATLPARGGDPVCSLSRSWWLAQERAGRIQLLRIKKPGQRKAGRVLLPVPQAIELVRRLTAEGAA